MVHEFYIELTLDKEFYQEVANFKEQSLLV